MSLFLFSCADNRKSKSNKWECSLKREMKPVKALCSRSKVESSAETSIPSTALFFKGRWASSHSVFSHRSCMVVRS